MEELNMKWFAMTLLVGVSMVAYAQTKTAEDMEKKISASKTEADTAAFRGWKNNAVASANLTQASFTNWAQGGANSLAYTVNLLGNATLYGEKSKWSNTLKLLFGQARLSEQGLRKTDDEIYFETLFIYQLWQSLNPYAAATVRTQFAPGYQYPDSSPKRQVSAIFDPAYLTQSVGFIYEPAPVFSTRLGVAAREVVTSKYTAYADDPKSTEIEKVRTDGGLESISAFRWEFLENMLFASRLELFAPFTEMDRVIVRWDNSISAKVNEYISVGINVQLVNDVNVTPLTQVKQSLGIGVSYTLL
jgi:hypothetical protein